MLPPPFVPSFINLVSSGKSTRVGVVSDTHLPWAGTESCLFLSSTFHMYVLEKNRKGLERGAKTPEVLRDPGLLPHIRILEKISHTL